MVTTGLIHIYYGDGKGKTTAVMGLALRAAGHGFPVVIAQFLKTGTSGECAALREMPHVTLLAQNPTNKFSYQMSEKEKQDTANALQTLLEAAFSCAQGARLLVLDEVLSAIGCGFLGEGALIRMLDERTEGLEVAMTGHILPPLIAEQADYISYVQKQRHPYDRGVQAREGIEL